MAVLLFPLHVPVHASARMENGTFETGIEGWSTNSSTVTFELADSPTHQGLHSAHISYSKTSSYGIEYLVKDIQPDASYKISGYLFATALPDKAFMRIAWYQSADGSGSQLSTSDTSLLDQTDIWQEISAELISPSDAHSAKIRILVSAGSVFADDITFNTFTSTHTPTPLPTQTPSPTLLPTPTQTPAPISQIFISEFMPYPPTGELEWIELYNAQDFEVTLTNWYLDDIPDGGSSPRLFTAIIPAHGYKAITLSTSILNNSDDMARLLNASKQEIDAVEYGESERGMSIGWNEVESTSYCLQAPSQNKLNNGCHISAPTQEGEIVENNSPPAQLSLQTASIDSISAQSPSDLAGKYRINAQIESIGVSEQIDPLQPILGTNDSNTDHMKEEDSVNLPIIGYSILSILSIGAKMKIDI